MLKMEVVVSFPEGVHTRPATIFVREAARFASHVELTRGEDTINGKSIMGLLMLALGPGSKVTLTVSGPDENLAMETLSNLLSGQLA